MTEVFMDERYIGTADNAKDFVEKVKAKRREGELHKEVNVFYNEDLDEIHIETTKGRTRRPVIIVENGKSKLTEELTEKLITGQIKWKDLVEQGIVEYLDASEEENAYVALYEEELTKDHTHLEISPAALLGHVTSLVPYSNYGSSSRLIRGSKIQKQSLGVYAGNFLLRLDTDSNFLHYPQNPMVKTFMHDVTDYDQTPSGTNLVIAVMSYEGYNMDDAIILNKASVQRGLARSTYFKPYSLDELRYSGGLMDEIGVPDKEVRGYRSEKDYKSLEEDGVVYMEAELGADDVVIGRTSPPRFLGSLEEFNVAANIRRESSSALGEGAKGKVDFVILTENEEGNRLVQVRLREQRIPEIGDKFASRHGQKGVIGMIFDQADMPFSNSGIVPDLIFSPHSIPSRMTISHLIEVVGGKVGALRGKQIDGTTFDAEPEEALRKQLLELGFRHDGTETFYNGVTGKMFKAKIYVGNMYYLRLKHMVANKLHARAAGRIQLLTRQPVEGRSVGGGLRVGEMEKDCLVAHGASLLLKERFDSDKSIVYVCENTGLISFYDYYRNKPVPAMGATGTVAPVEVSYAFKLLLDELKSMGMYPKLYLKDKF